MNQSFYFDEKRFIAYKQDVKQKLQSYEQFQSLVYKEQSINLEFILQLIQNRDFERFNEYIYYQLLQNLNKVSSTLSFYLSLSRDYIWNSLGFFDYDRILFCQQLVSNYRINKLEIQYSQKFGNGIFATEDIKENEVIIFENPIAYAQSIPDLMLNLYQAQFKLSQYQEYSASLLFPQRLESSLQLQDFLGVYATLFHPYNSLANSQQNQFNAVYPTFSLLNHSCVPNTISCFINSQIRLSASKMIQKGEQIFTTYYSDMQIPYSDRQIALQKYGFRCQCEWCEQIKNIDTKKVTIEQIQQQNMSYCSNFSIIISSYMQEYISQKNFQKALYYFEVFFLQNLKYTLDQAIQNSFIFSGYKQQIQLQDYDNFMYALNILKAMNTKFNWKNYQQKWIIYIKRVSIIQFNLVQIAEIMLCDLIRELQIE